MIDPAMIGRIEPFLSPPAFYRERHGVIYSAMLALFRRGEPGDLVTLSAELERSGKLDEVGGASYLARLANACPTSIHGEHYGRTVERMALYRNLSAVGAQIVALAYDQPGNPDEAISRAEAMLYDLRRGRVSGALISPTERASRALIRYTDLHTGQQGAGVPFGWRDLDSLTKGAHPGELIIIAGRPSIGKTSLMQNAAEHMAQSGAKVLLCSAEMPEWQLSDRSVAMRIGCSAQDLQEAPFADWLWAEINTQLGKLEAEPLWVYDDPDMTTGSIRAIATEMRSRIGLDVLIVDYLQLLRDQHGPNENERVGHMCRHLKATARILDLPLICGSQLNRESEGRADKRPQLSDLRGSGAIEQDSDVVLLIHRDSYYWNKTEWAASHPGQPYPENVTELIIAKQRNGPRGKTVSLAFLPTTMQFRDYEGRYAD